MFSSDSVDFLVDFFASTVASTAHFRPVRIKKKSTDNRWIISAFSVVGVTGFEPATTRPPDVYSNRTELRPDSVPADKRPILPLTNRCDNRNDPKNHRSDFRSRSGLQI
mgnify:CR=1 FL=1